MSATLNETELDLDDDDDEADEYYDDYENVNNAKKYTRLDTTKLKDNKFYENYSKEERIRSYKKFYLHYGACCLVWFIYLPVLIFVTSFVSELFRLRLVISKKLFYS